jgi:hypothetical protein
VLDWLGYRGPLTEVLRVLSPRLGDRLLVLYVARILMPAAGSCRAADFLELRRRH